MCRILFARAQCAFELAPHLEALALIARDSKEYQGHGWGCAWVVNEQWRTYHDIRPIWEDDLRGFGSSTMLVVHARSAFRDEGICVENNMPFSDDEYVFVFNGELRGVRIKEQGRIGAEKIFNYIKRFNKGDMLSALHRAVGVIKKRTRYVRAMNLIVASRAEAYLATHFGEDPDYFQLREKHTGGVQLICSEPYLQEDDWQPIANGTVERITPVRELG